MPPLKIAIAARCFTGRPVQRAAAAARAGARGIQFDARDDLRPTDLTETGCREFLHRLDELGIVVPSLSFTTRRGYYDETELDRRVAATCQALDFARRLRAHVVTIRTGPLPGNRDSPAWRLLHDVVSDLARYGNHCGATPALVVAGDSAQAIEEFLDSIKTGPVGIDFDPAAFIQSGQPPHEAYRMLHRFIVSVQARDAIREAGGAGLEVPLGRGEVDWIELLPLLDESAYSGWVTVHRTRGEDTAGDAVRAVQFLGNLLV